MNDPFGRPERRECCPTCGAIGYVVKPYCLAKDDDQELPQRYKDAWGPRPVPVVRAIVLGSREIFETCREALALADSLKVGVMFEFSGIDVVVWPGDDADQRARDWWQAIHGETPEQTRSRR